MYSTFRRNFEFMTVFMFCYCRINIQLHVVHLSYFHLLLVQKFTYWITETYSVVPPPPPSVTFNESIVIGLLPFEINATHFL